MNRSLIGLDAEEVGSGQMMQILIAPAVASQSSRVVEICARTQSLQLDSSVAISVRHAGFASGGGLAMGEAKSNEGSECRDGLKMETREGKMLVKPQSANFIQPIIIQY